MPPDEEVNNNLGWEPQKLQSKIESIQVENIECVIVLAGETLEEALEAVKDPLTGEYMFNTSLADAQAEAQENLPPGVVFSVANIVGDWFDCEVPGESGLLN